MQRGREGGDGTSSSGNPFGRLWSMMSRLFGGRDLLDDPSLNHPSVRPSESTRFSSGVPDDSPRLGRSKGPVIMELNSDDEEEEDHEEEDEDIFVEGIKKGKAWANRNPLVEHPEDQTDEHTKNSSKSLSCRTVQNEPKGEHPPTQGVSYRRVAYGGIKGAYYTATTSRRTGSDGTVLEESKQMDRTTGQAAHRISKGINDKGHSVLRKLNSDGKVDTMQTLHNLEEDDLAVFERTWRGNADRHLPGWEDGFGFHSNSGIQGSGLTSWSGRRSFPFRDPFGEVGGYSTDQNSRTHSSTGRPKKVVTINIE